MPSILFLNRVYPPMSGATGDLLAELAQALARKGDSVTIVTSGSAEAHPEDGSWKMEEAEAPSHAGPLSTVHLPPSTVPRPPSTVHRPPVRIERVGGLPFTRASHFKRAISYLSLYPRLLGRALRLPKHDIVVTMTDPPLHLVLGPPIKWIKGGRLYHWAQDVYPEIAEELGVIRKNGLRACFLRALSTWSMKRCDLVIAVGECMKTRLIARGIPPNKIVVMPNWAQSCGGDKKVIGYRLSVETPSPYSLIPNPSSSPSAPPNNQEPITNNPTPYSLIPNPYSSPSDGAPFTVMYSGNFGLAHTFEPIVEAVRLLATRDATIQFHFVGDGPRLPWLKEQLSGCANAQFLPFQPPEKLQASLASADLHLASMRKDLCGLVVPSKVYGILAAGRPCLFIGPRESEVARLIASNGCGEVLEDASGETLAEKIQKWKNSPEDLQKAAKKAEELSGTLTVGTAVDAPVWKEGRIRD